MRRGQEDAALRDLGEVIHTSGTTALEERRRIAEALAFTADPVLTPAPSRARSSDGSALERFAAPFLDQRQRESTPYVLHSLVVLAAADRGWSDVLVERLARRLLEDFPAYAAAPPLLTRVATTAAGTGHWPIARQAWQTLLARAPAAATPPVRMT